jgi:hypothetical protein
MKNLERLREYAIRKGVPAEEFDGFVESPIIRDIGEGLALSLMNDDSIGEMLVMMMMEIEDLKGQVAELKGGN